MEYIAYILIVVGLVFFLGTSIGLLRFPDFYTRMHAAGKGDTLSTVLILAGCIFAVASQGEMSWLLGLMTMAGQSVGCGVGTGVGAGVVVGASSGAHIVYTAVNLEVSASG